MGRSRSYDAAGGDGGKMSERIKKVICVAIGHEIVSGRGMLYRDVGVDLKWKACLRCGQFWPEGGPIQVQTEYKAIQDEQP